MSKLVYSALALTLVSMPGFASENEWSSLDQEIANLSASLSAQNMPGPKVAGYIRTSWRNSSDEILAGGTAKESGFKLDGVRIEVAGDAGADYSYKISFELKSGSASLRDAYVTWKMAENIEGQMGRFRQPFVRSGLGSNKNLLFMQRTALGDLFDSRDEGLMISGSFDTVNWWIAGQNSNDSKEDEYLFSARLTANLMGAGMGKVEGAYGAGEETCLTAGLAFADKQELDDGQHTAFEASFTHGPFSIAAEIVDFDKGTGGSFGGKSLDYGTANFGISVDPADTTPWDVTFSYMFTEMYEAAVRWEDADDSSNTERVIAAVNRYIQGHDIKWTAQWMSVSSDVSANEFDEIGVGVTVAF